MRRLNEKRNYLKQLEQERVPWDYQVMRKLSRARNREIRWRVAQVAPLYPSRESEDILLALLDDKAPLVRVNACDSLAFSQSDAAFARLRNMLRDKEYLVRGYGVLSLGDVAMNSGTVALKNEAITALEEMLLGEKAAWVIVAAFYTLTLLGKEGYFTGFIVNLRDRDYRIQSHVLNSLLELLERGVKIDHEKAREELEHFLGINTIQWLQQKAERAYQLLTLNRTGGLPGEKFHTESEGR